MVIWKKQGSWLARIRDIAENPAQLRRFALVGGITVVGVIIIFAARAASNSVSLESEANACSGLQQNTASASGGRFIRFGNNVCSSSCLGQVINNFCWKPVRLGAGGFVDGMQIAPDGTKVVRTDAANAWIMDAQGIWQPLVSENSMKAAGMAKPKRGGGVIAVHVAPSNSSTLYMMWQGFVFKSTNKGVTWAKTSYNASPGYDPNGLCRAWNERMAIDPTNENVVYASSIASGLFMTTDGGATWIKTNVPLAQDADGDQCNLGLYQNNKLTPGIIGVAVDPSSGTVSNRTKTIWATSHKNGVYRSTDAGATWSQVSGGPSTSICTVVSKTGVVYQYDVNAKLWRYKSGTWQQITPPGYTGALGGVDAPDIGVSPRNENYLATMDGSGYLWLSFNGGDTWTNKIDGQVTSPDIPWLEASQYMGPGQVVWDPQVDGRLWVPMGAGVVRADNIGPSTTNVSWVHQSKGIEELVISEVISPPYTASGQGRLNVAVHDFGNMHITNPDTWSAKKGPTNRFNGNWSTDWATANPNFIVANTSDIRGCCYGDGLALQAGYSNDGGSTWSRFASMPENAQYTQNSDPNVTQLGYGTIAAGDTQHILWETSIGSNSYNKLGLYYTANGGQSWQDTTPANITNRRGLHRDYFLHRRNITYDRQDSRIAYLYYSDATVERFYKSTSYGAPGTWQEVFTNTSPTAYGSNSIGSWEGPNNVTLKAVDAKQGHLFFAGGPSGGTDDFIDDPTAGQSQMWFTSNGGANWLKVTGIEAMTFGIGPALAGTNGYPTIYFAGNMNGDYGLWRGKNFDTATGNATWDKIGNFPGGVLDGVCTIDGDRQTIGKVYVGTCNQGVYYGQPQ